MKSLITFFSLFLALSLFGFLAGCGKFRDDRPVLNLFIWHDFIDPEVVAEFEEEFGVRVVESNYVSNEDMLAKVQAGGVGYDLIVPSDYMIQVMRRQGLLLELDHGLLPNLGNIDPRFANPSYDPGLRFSVPYQWGTTGIGFNTALVQNVPSSWKEFFDPAFASGYSNRLSLLDDPREVIGTALLALGYSPNTVNPSELEQARALILGLLPHVAKFDSDAYEDSLAANEMLVAMGWSGEVVLAMEENESVSFRIPSEGTLVFMDNFAIPVTCDAPELAHAFIDFILRPDIAARIFEYTYFPPANAAAKAFIDEESLSGPSFILPPPDRSFGLEDVGEAVAFYERIWNEIKSR